MYEEIMKEASKSIWKDLGERAARKAVETLVGEGIKATIDVIRRRVVKLQNHELDERFKRQKEREKREESSDDDESSDDESSDDESPDADDGRDAPEDEERGEEERDGGERGDEEDAPGEDAPGGDDEPGEDRDAPNHRSRATRAPEDSDRPWFARIPA
jgi:hypothetical protein